MKIRGILFDKDGTLIDFYSLWLSATETVIPNFLEENGLPSDERTIKVVLEAIGVKDGTVDPNGAIAYKPFMGIAEDIREALVKEAIPVTITTAEICSQIVEMFDAVLTAENREYVTFTDTKKLFQELKNQGIYIGLATADTYGTAKKCMQGIGVFEYFDFIGSDDGVMKAKPDPDMLERFAGQFGIAPEEIAVVGDTKNDIRFAKSANAVSIGVLCGLGSKQDLENADYIIDSVDNLLSLLKREAVSAI